MSELRPFRFWCQKVLPLVYDDSLSYYELLCKVVEYLNNMINDLNKMGITINELNDKFNELKSYVDNYFNNLDVQDEINKKIDDLIAKDEFWSSVTKIMTVLTDYEDVKNQNLNTDTTVYEKINNVFTDTGLSAIFNIVENTSNKKDGYTTFGLSNGKTADYNALIQKIPTAITSMQSGVPRGIWDVAYSYVGQVLS